MTPKKINLKFRPGDKVQHKLFSHLYGFITDAMIKPGGEVMYVVEVYDDSALKSPAFYEHELDSMGKAHPLEVGFGEKNARA